jgi:hypothetical protein
MFVCVYEPMYVPMFVCMYVGINGVSKVSESFFCCQEEKLNS